MREEINYEMAKSVSDTFRENYYCDLYFFVLNSVLLEEKFETSLIE